ncbi:MAG: PAS domain-containing sensor histidine kinase [Nitrospirota bacterium]
MTDGCALLKYFPYDEALVAGVMDNVTDVVMVLDSEARIQFINHSGEELLGYARSDLAGRPAGVIVDDERSEFARALGVLTDGGDSGHCDVLLLTRAGERIRAAFYGVVLRDNGRRIRGIVGVVRDIRRAWSLVHELEEKVSARTSELLAAKAEAERAYHDLKMAQAQLIQAEKLSSLGQLAAGVAHEINNPIGFVGTNLRVLGEYAGDLLQLVAGYEALLGAVAGGDATAVQAEAERGRALGNQMDARRLVEDLKQLTMQSEEGIERVRQIVQNLKDFSRVDQPGLTSVDINGGIENTLAIAWNELKYKAEVVKELQPLPAIQGHPQQLNQVFLNLLVNATQAMTSRGTVWVRTAVRGDHVVVEVEDTGSGISQEHLDKIFDPFFTTKPVGKGTGLGLSISYGIVQQHGGKIEVESAVGRGTRFRVLLPIRSPIDDEQPGPHSRDVAA